MSKLQSAKSAIEAEIAHAKQGLAYYQSRIDDLEQTLSQLDSIIASESAPATQRGRRQKQPLSEGNRAKRGRTKHVVKDIATGGMDLPSTPSEYWMDLITDQPQTAPEILKSAVDSLGFTPSPAQVQKLRQRLTPALQALLKSEKIRDSGSRRERRFFKV
ncbi:hypothetical protein [Noviherbaspirillum sp.]|uniref:hypothetical protein n=1 Tax=Noviherbaspirillum sp. TaxID=1926288 RepID=UPI002B46AF33|nr:hypothetical protein [Noviherbaspirillum sp.]HJV81754.1 hypothetical protein [Noviherbaspirillum sp.]